MLVSVKKTCSRVVSLPIKLDTSDQVTPTYSPRCRGTTEQSTLDLLTLGGKPLAVRVKRNPALLPDETVKIAGPPCFLIKPVCDL